MSTHTPTPWTIHQGEDYLQIIRETESGPDKEVTGITKYPDDEDEANAAHIVRCVNAHDALVQVAEKLALATEEGDDIAQGTHYADKDGKIRCKGSFLALVEAARQALAQVAP